MMNSRISQVSIANQVPTSAGVLVGLEHLKGDQADMRDALNRIITPVWDRAEGLDDPQYWWVLANVLECVCVRLYVRGSQELARSVSHLVQKARFNESILPLPF